MNDRYARHGVDRSLGDASMHAPVSATSWASAGSAANVNAANSTKRMARLSRANSRPTQEQPAGTAASAGALKAPNSMGAARRRTEIAPNSMSAPAGELK